MREKYFLLSEDFHDIKIPSDMVATPPHEQLKLLITVCTVYTVQMPDSLFICV